MKSHLGTLLRRARGEESRVSFARKLGLSYTFVRAMEYGHRSPSDRVLADMASRLELDPAEFLIAAWSDRSPELARVLRKRGIEFVCSEEEETADQLGLPN